MTDFLQHFSHVVDASHRRACPGGNMLREPLIFYVAYEASSAGTSPTEISEARRC